MALAATVVGPLMVVQGVVGDGGGVGDMSGGGGGTGVVGVEGGNAGAMEGGGEVVGEVGGIGGMGDGFANVVQGVVYSIGAVIMVRGGRSVVVV